MSGEPIKIGSREEEGGRHRHCILCSSTAAPCLRCWWRSHAWWHRPPQPHATRTSLGATLTYVPKNLASARICMRGTRAPPPLSPHPPFSSHIHDPLAHVPAPQTNIASPQMGPAIGPDPAPAADVTQILPADRLVAAKLGSGSAGSHGGHRTLSDDSASLESGGAAGKAALRLQGHGHHR